MEHLHRWTAYSLQCFQNLKRIVCTAVVDEEKSYFVFAMKEFDEPLRRQTVGFVVTGNDDGASDTRSCRHGFVALWTATSRHFQSRNESTTLRAGSRAQRLKGSELKVFNALKHEFDQHGLDLSPDRAYSPASIAKAYLRKNGDRAAENDGSRAECRIRHTALPGVHLDFKSQYPPVNALLGKSVDAVLAQGFEDAEEVDVDRGAVFGKDQFERRMGLGTGIS